MALSQPASQRRIDVLTRQLCSAAVDSAYEGLADLQPQELFQFITGDNLKLRLRIMEFLKVLQPA